ncbi:MAG: hypothetical protein H0X51_03080 [Parachlamydiaceae bacterium]|nr:hypothetical protein [Parachlamydiaceae bacterium]
MSTPLSSRTLSSRINECETFEQLQNLLCNIGNNEQGLETITLKVSAKVGWLGGCYIHYPINPLAMADATIPTGEVTRTMIVRKVQELYNKKHVRVLAVSVDPRDAEKATLIVRAIENMGDSAIQKTCWFFRLLAYVREFFTCYNRNKVMNGILKELSPSEVVSRYATVLIGPDSDPRLEPIRSFVLENIRIWADELVNLVDGRGYSDFYRNAHISHDVRQQKAMDQTRDEHQQSIDKLILNKITYMISQCKRLSQLGGESNLLTLVTMIDEALGKRAETIFFDNSAFKAFPDGVEALRQFKETEAKNAAAKSPETKESAPRPGLVASSSPQPPAPPSTVGSAAAAGLGLGAAPGQQGRRASVAGTVVGRDQGMGLGLTSVPLVAVVDVRTTQTATAAGSGARFVHSRAPSVAVATESAGPADEPATHEDHAEPEVAEHDGHDDSTEKAGAGGSSQGFLEQTVE